MFLYARYMGIETFEFVIVIHPFSFLYARYMGIETFVCHALNTSNIMFLYARYMGIETLLQTRV